MSAKRNQPPYAVGYGKPPKKAQYKPGQSGNLSGKPKGTKNYNTILRQILYRRLPIRDRGKLRHVSIMEAILLKFTELALRGDPKAATFLLNRGAVAQSDETSPAELSHEDQEILRAFERRVRRKMKEQKGDGDAS
jgi:hypothetical protein